MRTMLRLFKLLPKKALKNLPEALVKSGADCQKAYADCQKSDAGWLLEARNSFHKKWCGCKEWNGKEIVFK